jgi:hypothetical protein
MYRVWEKGQRVLLEVFSDTSLAEIAATHPSPAVRSPADVASRAISPAKSQPA